MIMEGKKKAVEALAEVKNTQQGLVELSRQLKRQRAITKALWKIVSEKLGLTEEQLSEVTAQVEEEESVNRKVADLCPQCGRSLQDNHTACIYCGTPVVHRTDPF